MRCREIATIILYATGALIGALCIHDALESETFFASEFAVPGIANAASATLGIVLLWQSRNSPDRARLSRWGSVIAAVVLVLTFLWVLVMLISVKGTA